MYPVIVRIIWQPLYQKNYLRLDCCIAVQLFFLFGKDSCSPSGNQGWHWAHWPDVHDIIHLMKWVISRYAALFEAARLMQLVSESWIILLGQNENMLEHCCGLKIIYDKIKTKIHERNIMAFVWHVKHYCAVPFLIGMLWFAPILLSSPVWLLSGRRKLFKFLQVTLTHEKLSLR